MEPESLQAERCKRALHVNLLSTRSKEGAETSQVSSPMRVGIRRPNFVKKLDQNAHRVNHTIPRRVHPMADHVADDVFKTGALGLATTPRKSGFLLSACRRRALCGTTLATILHLRSHRREAMSTGVSTRRRAA